MLKFNLTGRWDEVEAIKTLEGLREDLLNINEGDEEKTESELIQFKPAYNPLGLSGVYLVCGVDTAANGYPEPTDPAIDKQGNPITIVVTPQMAAIDILAAVVQKVDTLFTGFPHHCFPEGLDIDVERLQLHFHMGS